MFSKINNYIYSIIALTLMLNGCATKVNLTKEIKKEVNFIQISTDVNISNLPILITSTDALTMSLGGAISGAIVGSNLSEEEKLYKYIKDNEINIKNIYKQALYTSIQKNSFLKNKITKKDARYILKSNIQAYGLVYHHNILNNKYKPQTNVTIELYDRTNKKTIWSNNDFITSYNSNTLEKTYDEYFTNPEYLKKALSQAFTIATEHILEDLDE